MCKTIFVIGNAVVLYSGFSLIKDVTNLEAKGVYVGYLFKKRGYWLKEVPEDLIDTHFKDKEVRDDGMIDSIIQ